MTAQDIEKLKAFCDEKGIEMIPTSDRDVWEFKSKDEPIRVECETTAGCEGKGFSWMDIRVRSNKPNLPFGGCKEFLNHIEESIEAFLNRKP